MNTTPDVSPDARDWLSVADFAAARGCSIRTVKRWVENGEVATRKDGARRFVRPLEKGTQEGHSDGPQGTREKGHAPSSMSLAPLVHAQNEGRKGHAEGTQTVPPSPEVVSLREAQLRDDLTRERELNGFLRGLIEQRDRDAAELRAALREALKIAPRQLEAGGLNASAVSVPERAQSGAAGNDSPDALKGTRRGVEVEAATFSTYGGIADWLEKEVLTE